MLRVILSIRKSGSSFIGSKALSATMAVILKPQTDYTVLIMVTNLANVGIVASLSWDVVLNLMVWL